MDKQLLAEVRAMLSEPLVGHVPDEEFRRYTELIRRFDDLDTPSPGRIPQEVIQEGLLLRAAARGRLLTLQESWAEKIETANMAFQDAIESVRLGRQLALQGSQFARYLLGEGLDRLLVILDRHPELRLERLQSCISVTEECLPYVARSNPYLPVIGARISSACALLLLGRPNADAPHLTPEEQAAVLEQCRTWYRRALPLLASASPSDLISEQILGLLLNSLFAIAAVEAPLEVTRAPGVLDELRTRYIEFDRLRPLLSQEHQVAFSKQVVAFTIDVLVLLHDAVQIEGGRFVDFGVLSGVRLALSRLPKALWPRDTDATPLLDLVDAQWAGADSRTDFETLTWLADRIEVVSLMQVFLHFQMEAFGIDLTQLDLEHPRDEGWLVDDQEEAFIGMIFGVAGAVPPPRSSYVTAAIVRLLPAEVRATSLPEIQALVSGISESDALMRSGTIRLNSFITTMAYIEGEIDDEWWTELEDLVRADLEFHDALQFYTTALEVAVERIGVASIHDAARLLSLLEEVQAREVDGGWDTAVLEGMRARLLFIIVRSDPSKRVEHLAACVAYLDYLDRDDGRSLELHPFATSLRVECHRFLGHAGLAVLSRGDEGVEDVEDVELVEAAEAVRLAMANLVELHRDTSISLKDRTYAASCVSELVSVGTALGLDLEQPIEVEVPLADQIRISPMVALGPYIRGEHSVDAEVFKQVVIPAVEAVLRNLTSSLQGSTHAGHLAVLTAPSVVRRLGLDSNAIVRFGFAAYRALVADDPATAVLALEIAGNVTAATSDDPEASDLAEGLAERIAERFLPAAIRSPTDGDGVVRFLLTRSAAALNGGAVTDSEKLHRVGVALAAHIVALQGDDLDLGALAAYHVAEQLRINLADPEAALGWFAVYDAWVEEGALEGAEAEGPRARIEWDRRAAQRALGESDAAVDLPVPELRAGGSSESGDPPRPSGHDIADRFVELRDRILAAPSRPLNEDDRAVIALTPDVPTTRSSLTHLWQLVLNWASLDGGVPSEVHGAARKICARLGGEDPRLPEQFARVHTIPLLEVAIRYLVETNEAALARSVLARLASRTNSLLLQTDLGPEYLARRPTTNHLQAAARAAFAADDIGLTVALAEASRAKLLAAIASGAHQPFRTPAADFRTSIERYAELAKSGIAEPEQDRIEWPSADERLGADQTNRVADLCIPWVTLLGVAGDEAIQAPDLSGDQWETLLREPSLGSIVAGAPEGVLILYVVRRRGHFGIIVIWQGEVVSYEYSEEEAVPPERLNDPHLLYMTAGAVFANAIAEYVADRWPDAVPAEIRLIDWDSGNQEMIQAIAYGFWFFRVTAPPEMDALPDLPSQASLIASARLLRRTRLGPPAPGTTTIIGDPGSDLVGAWLELAAWRRWHAESLSDHMGIEATVGHLIEALCTSNTVIVSGHTAMQSLELGLALVDGILTWSDLRAISDRLVCRQVVLSCCSAALPGSGQVPTEALGVASVLLALGVNTVIAPPVAVPDLTAGLCGVLLAEQMATTKSLAKAHDLVGRRLVHHIQAGDGDPFGGVAELREELEAEVEPEASVPREAFDDAERLAAHLVLGTWSKYSVMRS